MSSPGTVLVNAQPFDDVRGIQFEDAYGVSVTEVLGGGRVAQINNDAEGVPLSFTFTVSEYKAVVDTLTALKNQEVTVEYYTSGNSVYSGKWKGILKSVNKKPRLPTHLIEATIKVLILEEVP